MWQRGHQTWLDKTRPGGAVNSKLSHVLCVKKRAVLREWFVLGAALRLLQLLSSVCRRPGNFNF